VAKTGKILLGPIGLDCNRGDQALLWEAIGIVRSARPDCELALMSESHKDPDDPQTRQTRKLGIRILPMLVSLPRRGKSERDHEFIDSGWSYFKMKVRAGADFIRMLCLLTMPRSRRLARWLLGKERYQTYEYLRECDFFVVKGGGFIYAYRGLRWAYFIWFGLYFLMLAQRCNVGVIILPNSFGPFDTNWGRWLARKVLSRCNIVTVREPESLKALKNIVPGKAKLYPDMAFRLASADSAWARKELKGLGIPVGERPCVGITMRPWRFPNSKDPRAMYDKYVKAFALLFRHLLEQGYQPVLYAHTIGPYAHEDDRIALKDAMDASSVAEQLCYIDGDYDCRQIKSFYGFMDLMVCTRFHSAIFSMAQTIPCVAVSYQGHKATGTMKEIGLEDYTISVDAINAQTFIETFDRLEAERGTVKQKIEDYMKKCLERLNDLQLLIASEIHGKQQEDSL
jgi:colanic acid/amylovoran biosynthesis protein